MVPHSVSSYCCSPFGAKREQNDPSILSEINLPILCHCLACSLGGRVARAYSSYPRTEAGHMLRNPVSHEKIFASK